MGKRILVTGGAGFIGSHIADALIERGHQVTIVDNLSTGCRDNIPDQADFYELDVTKENFGAHIGNDFSAVFHLAAQSSGALSFSYPRLDMNSHVVSTFNLLNWCRENKINRFFYAGSTTVYGETGDIKVTESFPLTPLTFYAAGKISAESYIQLFQSLGIETTILRMPNVYGPNQNLANKDQGMVSIFLSYLLEDSPIIVKGSMARYRDFIYIDDVVSAWMAAFDNPISDGKIYNLTSGKKTTVKEIVDELITSWGRMDYPVECLEGTPGDQFGIVFDNRKIVTELQWAPTVGLKEGIRKMVACEKQKIR